MNENTVYHYATGAFDYLTLADIWLNLAREPVFIGLVGVQDASVVCAAGKVAELVARFT